MEELKKFKILCIDGGGIKGLYSAQILAKFEEVFKVKISDCFDMLCGTSTGGIIALAASLKIPMVDIVSFYKKNGPAIFNEKLKKRPHGSKFLTAKQVFFRGKYSAEPLRQALENVFGSRKIAESNNLLCIPAYNVNTATPRVFKKNYENFTEDDRKRYVDVALATAAAPTFFPMMEIEGDQFADGGLWANNPILVGLAEFLYKFSDDKRFNGLEILSISSCEQAKGECHKKVDRSFLSWKNALFDAYSLGQSKSVMFFLKCLKGKFNFQLNYERIFNEPVSAEQAPFIDIDNASPTSLKMLCTLANHTANQAKMKPEISSYFKTGKTINI